MYRGVHSGVQYLQYCTSLECSTKRTPVYNGEDSGCVHLGKSEAVGTGSETVTLCDRLSHAGATGTSNHSVIM